ncbi:MAG: hypothetical protein V2I74_11230 [Erythrobacter sp.]|jgi:hypothetical protein|nr:hypothetical protein [Erythrobacter sp.]
MLLDFYNEYRVLAQHIASVALALAIWRWGGGPERWLIGIFVATMVAPTHVFGLFGIEIYPFGPHGWIFVAIDVIAMIAFVVIALNANRNYPLWVAGFQLVAIGAHAARGMVDAVSPFAYLVLSIGPSYCQLVIIFAGLVRHIRRENRFGPYREWRLTREPFPVSQS